MATQQHIIVVEDHEELNAMICRVLSKAGHRVHGAASIEDLQEYPDLAQTDVFVVDWNLPGESGLDFVKRLRGSLPLAGIIMMTAKSGTENQLEGYANGADFYLSKPVRGEDLLRAVDILRTRRSSGSSDEPSLHENVATIWRSRLTLQRGGMQTKLTMQDVKLLAALALSENRSLEAWQFAEILDADFSGESVGAIEVRISRLRKKLATVLGPGNHLLYVRGEGYRLSAKIIVR